MAIKKAKRWGNTKCGRWVSDIDRFNQIENKDRRVVLGRAMSSVLVVHFLKSSAKRKNVSISLRFEQIFLYVMFYDLLDGVVLPVRNTSSRIYVQLILNKEDKVKFPKIYMHPVFKKILKEDARRRGMSISFYIYHLLLVYQIKTETLTPYN